MSKTKHIDNEYSISEVYRYLANAKETLSKSPIEYGRYTDSKYVREAAGMAYLAALKAIDVYLISIGLERKVLPKSIDGYWNLIRKKIPLNGKLTASVNTVYENLHIFAYYRGGVGVEMVKEGFSNAKKIIDMLSKLMPETSNRESMVCEPEVKYRKTKKINL